MVLTTTDTRNALHRCAHSAVASARVGGIVHWILFIVEHDTHYFFEKKIFGVVPFFSVSKKIVLTSGTCGTAVLTTPLKVVEARVPRSD